MKVINGKRPPNIDAIAAVFPMARGPNVVFAYGKKIFNPSGEKLPNEIIEHEKVHGERQLALKGGVEEWWKRYLNDLDFRYEEELVAHRKEYRTLTEEAPSRQMRRGALKHVAKKLCSPLYGKMVTMDQAMKDLKKEN